MSSAAIAATAALILSAVVAGSQTDLRSMCIIEQSLNACNRDSGLSKRLLGNISFDNPPIPSWVTLHHTGLFERTINEALTGQLTGTSDYPGYGAWRVSYACDGPNNTKIWNDRGCYSINDSGFMTGYASLGFHPLGMENGTWLTQILGEISYVGGHDNAGYVCTGTGLYVQLNKINDTEPRDSRFESSNDNPAYGPASGPAVGSFRTDNDLIAHGVVLNCTAWALANGGCQNYSLSRFPGDTHPENYTCYPQLLVNHFDCPATNSGYVGLANCTKAIVDQDWTGSGSRPYNRQGWGSSLVLLVALVLCL